jgi:hypothetical protein
MDEGQDKEDGAELKQFRAIFVLPPHGVIQAGT